MGLGFWDAYAGKNLHKNAIIIYENTTVGAAASGGP